MSGLEPSIFWLQSISKSWSMSVPIHISIPGFLHVVFLVLLLVFLVLLVKPAFWVRSSIKFPLLLELLCKWRHKKKTGVAACTVKLFESSFTFFCFLISFSSNRNVHMKNSVFFRFGFYVFWVPALVSGFRFFQNSIITFWGLDGGTGSFSIKWHQCCVYGGVACLST